MAKATRVHSTPPTNTSARHSRRSILGAIAGSAAAAGGIAAAEGINLSANKINPAEVIGLRAYTNHQCLRRN